MTIIKTSHINKVFKRIHDGFIFGNEIVLGLDFSTGVERQDLAEYYEEIVNPELPTPPTPTGYGVVIPEKWETLFPDDKLIVGNFEIQLQRTLEQLVIDVVYNEWKPFKDELLKPENESLNRVLKPFWDFVSEQINMENTIEL